MSEYLPYGYSTSYIPTGLFTVEEHERFYEPFLNHGNDMKVTAITSMIDQATHDVSLGRAYLMHNWSAYSEEAALFLDDAIHILHLTKHLSQSGYLTTDYLNNVGSELKRAINDFYTIDGDTERHVANYLETALENIIRTQYMESIYDFESDQVIMNHI